MKQQCILYFWMGFIVFIYFLILIKAVQLDDDNETAMLNKYPFIVLINDANSNSDPCTGVIIKRSWILASISKCYSFFFQIFENTFENTLTDTIVIAADFSNTWSVWVAINNEHIPIKKMILHKEYNHETSENDIVLIKLMYATLSSSGEISIWEEDERVDSLQGKFCEVVDWELSENGFVLREVTHPVVTLDNCNMEDNDIWLCTIEYDENFYKGMNGPLIYAKTLKDDSVKYYLAGFKTEDNKFSREDYKRWTGMHGRHRVWIDRIIQNENKEHNKLSINVGQQMTEKELSDWTFLVSILTTEGKQCCTGTLIRRNWVLTSRDCRSFDESNDGVVSAYAFVESAVDPYSAKNPWGLVPVDEINIPPFNKPSLKHIRDTFLLMKLRWPLKINPPNSLIPVITHQRQSPHEGTICKSAGWANETLTRLITDEGGGLKKMELPLVPVSVCEQFYGNETIPWTEAFCTIIPDYLPDIFVTGLGWPLICNDIQVSVISAKWNHPEESIDTRRAGIHMAIGWLRLEQFSLHFEELLMADYSSLHNAVYGPFEDKLSSKWSFMVSIQDNGVHFMAGCLLTSEWILSGKFHSKFPSWFKLSKRIVAKIGYNNVVGNELTNENMQTISIVSFHYIHSHVGLVLFKLKYPVKIFHMQFDKKFLEPSSNVPPVGITCEAAGWPRPEITHWYHRKVFQRFNPLRTASYKLEWSLKVENVLFTKENENDTCLGDTGVPLVCNGYLYGMTAWGDRCHNPGVKKRKWVRIGSYLEQIKQMVDVSKPATEKWKFIVSITIHNEHVCIGNLIERNWVLTAAQCLKGRTLDDINIRCGIIDLEQPEDTEVDQWFGASVLITHPPDEPVIGLIKLRKSVTLSMSLVELVTMGGTYWFGSRYLTAGWPKVVDNGRRALREYEVYAINSTRCENFYGKNKIKVTDLCTHSLFDWTVSFLGYPGSPLICVVNTVSKQCGINTWGPRATSAQVWTRLDVYLQWIETTLYNTTDTRRLIIVPRTPSNVPVEEPIDESSLDSWTVVWYPMDWWSYLAILFTVLYLF